MFNYFTEADIAKTHRIHTVMENHCLATEFIKQLEAGDAEDFQDDFGKCLRTIGEYLNTDAFGKQIGKADVNDNAKLNLDNNARFQAREVKIILWGQRGKGGKRRRKKCASN